MKYELFIAVGDAAEAYSEKNDLNDVENAINEDYAPSLIRKEFETKEEMRAFQEGLELASEHSDFYVISYADVEQNRELVESLTL